jgi:dienelactone hydrolase
MREQLWLVPSGDPALPLRATMFRPEDPIAGPSQQRTLVVINHGTDEATRQAVSMPVFYWLSRWFVERGYVVVIPQRRGHGATGGELAESVGTCETADHYSSGQIAADDIAATVEYMTQQPFIAPRNVIVAGISTGGWAALALASRNLPAVGSIVNFAGGRGGHAYGRPNAVCNSAGLRAAAHRFGQTARLPTIWFYAENDSYFGPELASALAREWEDAGGIVEARIFPPFNADGHTIADDRASWDLWGNDLDGFLNRQRDSLSEQTAFSGSATGVAEQNSASAVGAGSTK